MARGRKPKPTTLKIAAGNPGKRRLNRHEPQPGAAPADVAPPAWLSLSAKGEWLRVAPELVRLGVLTTVDYPTLAGYCQAYARAMECETILAREGPTFETEHGPRKRPEATIAKECWQLARLFAAELGLTPSSRSRITTSPSEPQSRLQAFLDGNG